ncbi:response regulator receiver domain [Pseudomonas sp. MWU13-2100]|uniref:response regulator receiver domain n=1 Tax=Pseudomonas sp. MWU13-2100 TaxID=2935075 RepID=UPI00200EDFF1|nr:response regulator receiver domain [Pseudomonas sp. MWU13-2100]
MQAEVFEGEASEVNSHDSWLEHCLTAAKKFLKNAVVIDNEPFVEGPRKVSDVSSVIAPFDDGMGTLEIVGSESASIVEPGDSFLESVAEHQLDIRKVSDAFAEKGLNCAFVLPDDSNFDEELVVRRVLNSALISDIVVIDWYLYKNSSALTRRILKEIALSDVAENGRLRFICVYTGQTIAEQVYEDIKESLKGGGVHVDSVDEGVFSQKNKATL